MKCPNCQFDNLDTSSFCAVCGKPFSYSRNGNGSQQDPRPKKRNNPKKASTRKPSVKKKTASAKKAPPSSKSKTKKRDKKVPVEMLPPREQETQDRQAILKGVEITPLNDVVYEGESVEEKKRRELVENKSADPQVTPLASLNEDLPKVLWPEPEPQIELEDPTPEIQTKTEIQVESPPKPSLQARFLSLTSKLSKFPGYFRNLVPRVTLKQIPKPVLYVAAAVLVGGMAWFVLIKPFVFDKTRWSSTVIHPTLVVLNFTNDTDQDRYDSWSRALPYALATHLSHSADIHVLSPERVFDALQGSPLLKQDQSFYSRTDLKELAALTNADLILTGSLAGNGAALSIKTAVKRTKYGDDILEESLDVGNETEILAQAQALAKRIDAKLNFSQSENGPVENSPNGFGEFPNSGAYTHFVQGQWQFWQKQYRNSITTYESALELDPEFAQAHVEIGRAYVALGYYSRAGKHYQAALELIDRLSEWERLHVQGELYRLSEKTLLIAQDIYLRLLEVSPADPRTRSHLAELYTRLGQWDKASRTYERSITKQVETPNTYLGQSMTFALQGDYKRAQETIQTSILDLPDHAVLRMQLAWIHLMQGDFNASLGELERGYAVHPFYTFVRMKGDVLMLSGDLASAYSEYQRLLSEDEPIERLWGYQRLANLSILQGRFKQAREQLASGLEEADTHDEKGWSYRFHLDLARLALARKDSRLALQECDKAWKIAMQGETREFPRKALFLRGLAYLAQRRLKDAEETAALLKSLCEKGPGLDRMRSYHLLKGRIEMSRNNFVLAIEYISQAVELLPPQGPPAWEHNDHALYYDALAEAYYARGDPGRAYEELNKLRALSTGRIGFGDLYARTFYKQAKISEEKLFPETASKLYEKFLGFWGEGDLGSSEVSDARMRLRAIQGQIP